MTRRMAQHLMFMRVVAPLILLKVQPGLASWTRCRPGSHVRREPYACLFSRGQIPASTYLLSY